MDEIITKICKDCGENNPILLIQGRRWCFECKKKYMKEWRKKNTDHVKDYEEKYRAKNKEIIAKRQQKWKEENPDYFDSYRENNRELLRAKNRDYQSQPHVKKAMQERGAKWRKNNRDKANEQCARRYALKLQATVEKVCYETIRERDHTCYLCSVPFTEEERFSTALTQIDHKIPLSRGGEHSYKNCALTHARCNLSKHDKTPEEYWAT